MKGNLLLLLAVGVPWYCGAQTLAVQPVVTERPVVEAALVKPAENMSQMQPSFRFVQSRERAGKLKVLSSEVVADGVQKQVMQDERGVVYKRYLKDGQPLVSVNLARKLPQLKAEGSEVPTALWEDFEGYTGEGYDDWLPEGWTKKMAPGNEPVDSMVIDGVKRLINFNNTWRVTPTDTWGFLPMTSDGMMEAGVHFSYDYTDDEWNVLIPAVLQDEWMMTPMIEVAEYQGLYYNLAFDCSSAYYMDWDLFEYDLSRVVNNFEVLAKEEGAEEWTKLYDLERDFISNIDSAELYYFPFEYRQMAVDLSDYVGKKIQIAFRYYTTEVGAGNTAMVDAVLVGPRQLEALYDRPAGDFILGMSTDFMSLNSDGLFGPAYVDRVFSNLVAADGVSYEWSYEDADDEVATASEEDLTINLPYSVTTPPVLTVSAEGATPASYQWGDWGAEYDAPIMCNGGSALFNIGEASLLEVGVGNYDKSYGLGAFNFDDGVYCFGTGSADYWYGDTVVAIGNFFDKPTQPYVLRGLAIGLGALDADDDAEFSISILEYDEWGATGDTLAIGTCRAGDAISIDAGYGQTWYNLVFGQLQQKDEDGFVSELPDGLLVSTPIMIKMDGIHSPKVRVFAPLNQGNATPTDENNAAVYFKTDYQGQPAIVMEWAEDVLQDVHSSYAFSLYVDYPFLYADDTRYDAPVAGGTKRFEVMSYYVTDAWSIAEELPDWLAVEFAEGDEWGQLSVTVQPLGDAPKRECTFTLESLNSPSVQFTVSQDPDYSGVEAVEDASYRVETLKDGWNVLYPASARSLAVVDTNGRLVGEYELPENALMLPTAHLSTGVYFLRFDDGKVLKAVK